MDYTNHYMKMMSGRRYFFFYKNNAYLIGMVNFLKREPIESQKAVPQHPLVPDLNNQAGVKSHGFTIILKKNNYNINKTVKSTRQFFFFNSMTLIHINMTV